MTKPRLFASRKFSKLLNMANASVCGDKLQRQQAQNVDNIGVDIHIYTYIIHTYMRLVCSYNFMRSEPKRAAEFCCFRRIWIFVTRHVSRIGLHCCARVCLSAHVLSETGGAAAPQRRLGLLR